MKSYSESVNFAVSKSVRRGLKVLWKKEGVGLFKNKKKGFQSATTKTSFDKMYDRNSYRVHRLYSLLYSLHTM